MLMALGMITLGCFDRLGRAWRCAVEKSDHRHRRLLGARCERPRRRPPSEQSDERPPLHSINSSARASSFAGLKGRAGDAANVILSAVGYNLRLVLAWLRMILRVVLLALLQIFAIQPVLKPAS